MDVRSFNVSHFVKAEPLDKRVFFQKSFSIFKCVSPKKNFLSMMNKKGLVRKKYSAPKKNLHHKKIDAYSK